MQITCISRGSYGYSKQLAERLADRLGHTCISREEITDQATDNGIPVGKLDMAVVKKRPLSEELALEVERFKAFGTAFLCERALEQSLVFHGRTGHLVLPGLTHVLRVRAIADMESRIELAMGRLHLTRDKARTYNEQIDDDIQRWVRMVFNVDWQDPLLYDVTINAAHLSIENSAAALMHMAQLPEFQITPSNREVLDDLLLAARCRLAIGDDARTRGVNVNVRAEKGAVSVTYQPQQAREAEAIPDVLSGIEGLASVVCTMASTNILCIGERFDVQAHSFDHLVEIAGKWNAAIELVRLAGDEEPPPEADPSPGSAATAPSPAEPHGGILDDTEVPEPCLAAGCGVPEAMERLIQVGRAGGFSTLHGDASELLGDASRNRDYSLIVVGDVFSAKGAAQRRMKRDLLGMLSDRFRAPVIDTEDLKAQYLFGARQLASLLVFALLAAALYLGVFVFQEPILRLVSAGQQDAGLFHKVTVAAAVAVAIPIVAFTIGGFYANLLKLVKLE